MASSSLGISFGNTGLYYHVGARSAFRLVLKGLLALDEAPCRPDALTIGKLLVTCPLDGEPTLLRRHPSLAARSRRHDRVRQSRRAKVLAHGGVSRGKAELRWRVRRRLRRRLLRGGALSYSGPAFGRAFHAVAASTPPRSRRSPRRSCEGAESDCSRTLHVPTYDIEGLTGPTGFGDERPFVELDAAYVGNLDVRYVSADEISPIAGVRRGLVVHDEPQFRAGNYYWITAILRAAQRDASACCLPGKAVTSRSRGPATARTHSCRS